MIAQSNNLNVGIAGSYGAGNVLALGWDWQDTGNAERDTTIDLFKDIAGVNFQGSAPADIPEPQTALLISLGLLALVRRRAK